MARAAWRLYAGRIENSATAKRTSPALSAPPSPVLVHSPQEGAMPGWLVFVCTAAVVVACVYLLYVILRPDRF